MCKLADFGHRLTKVSGLDSNYVSKLIRVEEARQKYYEKDIAERSELLTYFEHKDEAKLMSSSVSSLNNQLVVMKDNLVDALEAEERARVAYENAVLRAKAARENILKLEGFVDLVITQSEILRKVNELKLKLDGFNTSSAEKRIGMLRNMQNYLENLQQRVLKQRIKDEFPILFQNMTVIFQSMITTPGLAFTGQNQELLEHLSENPVSAYCAVRIGLETLKLWKKMSTTLIQPLIREQFEEFESQLQEIKKGLPDWPQNAVDSSTQFRNTTVVLHFNHLFHDTPENHVEAPLRTETAIKLLSKKLQQLQRSTKDEGMRDIVLEKCNDILSPPLWCLPLVHAPQYLTNLWNTSEEAKNEESFIPLEFDSEWESDLDALASDEEGMVVKRKRLGRRRKHNQLNTTFDFDSKWKEKLGEEKSDLLCRLITPKPGDDDIAGTLRTTPAGKPPAYSAFLESSTPTSRRKRVVLSNAGNSSDEDQGENEAEISSPSHRQPRNPATGKRVRTPYGSGTLLEEFSPSDDEDKIVRVKLDWGAIGYLAKRIVQRIRRKPKPQVRALSIDTLVEHRVEKETKAAERFVHTNLRIHSLMTRILQQIKIQRLILDKVGVKDAHMSLWLHGRTSRGITKNIESGILCWLSKLDRSKVEELLIQKEQTADDPLAIETPATGLQFLRELEQVCKSSQPPSANEKSYTEDFENREQLKIAAFEYSKNRLLKKSGEPRSAGIRVNKSSKGGTPSKPIAIKKISSPILLDDGISLRQIGRLARLYEPPKDGHLSMMQQKNGEVLRSLFFRLSAAMNISQGSFATELYRRFNVKTCQTTISAWMRYKASVISTRLLDQYVLRWVEHHKKLLSPEDQQVLMDLVASRSGTNSRENDPNSKKERELTAIKVESTEIVVPDLPSSSHHSSSNIMDENMEGIMQTEEEEGAMQEEEEEEVDEEVDADGGEMQRDIDENSAAEEEVEEEDHKSVSAMSVDLNQQDQKENDAQSEDSIHSEPEDTIIPVSLKTSSTVIENLSDDQQSEEEQEEEEEEGEEGDDDDIEDEEDDSTDEVAYLSPILKSLHKSFITESNRRELTHSYIAQEATRLNLRLTQPALSKFVRECTFPYFARAREFCNHISRWLEYSSNKGTENGQDSKGINSGSCSACGRKRDDFDSQREFLEHIGVCKSNADIVPRAASKNSYFPTKMRIRKLRDVSVFQASIEAHEKKLADNELQVMSFAAARATDICSACSDDQPTVSCQWCSRSFHATCLPKIGNYSTVVACQNCYDSPVFFAKEIPAEKVTLLKVGTVIFLFDLIHTTWNQYIILSFKSNPSFTLLKELENEVYLWIDLNDCRSFVHQDVLDDGSEESISGTGRKRGRRPSSANEPPKKRRPPGRPPGSGKRGRKSQSEIIKELAASMPRTSKKTNEADNAYSRFTGKTTTNRRGSMSTEEEAAKAQENVNTNDGMNDTYLSFNSLKAALCTSGIACKAVDIAVTNAGSNVFACARPPGHHAGRYGCTSGCLSTGFCMLNNAAIALMYARVRWGLERIAIVDIDVHFGNGTAEIVKDDEDSFFASVHMIYGAKNDGVTDLNGNNKDDCVCGFYPAKIGTTEISDRYISVGVQPSNVENVVNQRKRAALRASEEDQDMEAETELPKFTPVHALISNLAATTRIVKSEPMDIVQDEISAKTSNADEFVGARGFVKALRDIIIPKMEAFQPQLLIISG